MPLRQEDQRFTVQASLHGIKTRQESEDGQLLTIKKSKNLIKNKNVSVLDLHQLHEKLNLSNLP